jgi:hypothetical protein
MHVIPLHGEMHDAKALRVTPRSAQQRQSHRRKHELTPQWRDARP